MLNCLDRISLNLRRTENHAHSNLMTISSNLEPFCDALVSTMALKGHDKMMSNLDDKMNDGIDN